MDKIPQYVGINIGDWHVIYMGSFYDKLVLSGVFGRNQHC